MAGESKDIELRIRARDDSEQTLDRISKRIQGQSKAFEEAAKKADEARAKQAAYAKTIEGVAELTERQRKKTEELARAVATAENRQQRSADRLEATLRRRAEAEQRLTDEFNKRAAAAARLVQETETERLWIGLLEQRERAQAEVNQRLAEQAEIQRRVEQDAARLAAQAEREAADAVKAADQRREAERRLTEEFNKRAAAAQQLVRQTEVERMWLGLLGEQEAKQARVNELRARLAQIQERNAAAQAKATAEAEKEAAAQQKLQLALSKAADEAIAAAKGYATLASSVRNVRVDTLSAQLRGIVSPTKEALRTLDGLDQAIADITTRTQAARGPLKGYRQDVATLEAAQKTLLATAANVTAYERQIEAVREARIEYTRARDEVTRLANELRQGVGSAETVRQMEQAKAALGAAAVAMRDQTQRARELRTTLREAGADTTNLASTQARLAEQARRSAAAVQQLTAAQKRYGTAVEQTQFSLASWLRGERTTLSFFQRLRGELLALTTTYIGLYGAIDLARGSIQAFRSAQAIESRLSVAVGDDAAAIRAEWDYLMMQADRLGFGFEKLALSYSKFAVAARTAGMSQNETRFIFERFAEAARVARMSTEDFEGSLKALEQMISKGQVTAEELRQQLGDRLPGAVAIFARGAGMSIADFTKQMEQSAITAEFVINAAREMGNVFGGEKLNTAVNGMEASLGRLDTAMFKFKLTIAEGGFADAFTKFIQELTQFLNSGDGTKFAQLLSDAFSAVIQVMRFAVNNIGLVKAALVGLLAVPFVRGIFAFVTAIQGLISVATTLWGVMSRASPLLRTVVVGFTRLNPIVAITTAAVAALVAMLDRLPRALDAIKNAQSRMEAAGSFSARFAESLRLTDDSTLGLFSWMGSIADWIDPKAEAEALEAGKAIGEAFQEGVAEGTTPDPMTGGDMDLIARKTVEKSLRQLAERNEKADRRSRMKSAEREVDERLSIVREEYDQLRQLAEQNIQNQEARAAAVLQIEQELGRALEIERRNFENQANTNTDLAAERRKRIAEEVAGELLRIEDELVKQQTFADPTATFDQRLQARLQAISYEYDKLLRKVDRLARSPEAGQRAQAAEARASIEAYVGQLQALETQRAKQEELTRLEQALNDQVSLRATQLERINALRETGQITEAQALEQIRSINSTVGEGITAAGDNLRAFAEQIRDLLDPTAFEELMARIDTVVARSNSKTLNLQLELETSERKVNDLLTQRQLLIEGIRKQRELGLITEKDMVDRINETNGRFRESISAGAAEVVNYAQLLDTMGDNPALQALVERMKQLQVETQFARQEFTQLQLQIGQGLVDGALVAFDAMAQSLAGLVQGTMSWKDAIGNVGDAMRSFFAQFLRDIAMAILKQQILNALQAASNGGGFWGQLASAAVSAASNHTGGIVGINSSGGGRRVDAAWFAGAERFHSGGLPGLRPDEVPSILQKGEEVLTRDDPRHILNKGSASGPTNIRNVLVDDRTKVPEAMASAEGEQVLLQFLTRNSATVRSVLR